MKTMKLTEMFQRQSAFLEYGHSGKPAVAIEPLSSVSSFACEHHATVEMFRDI